MNFTQQELLRNFMKKLGLTRKEFVEFYLFPRYKVSLRTLSNWLLPTESKEFKKIPDLTYRELCAAYFNYIEYSPKNRVDNKYAPGFSFNELGNSVVFPALWFTNGYWDLPEEYFSRFKDSMRNGKMWTETISFDPNDNANASFIITDKHEYKRPHPIYEQNFWIHVIRFESEPEAVASIRTFTQLDDNLTLSEGFGELIFFEDAYYVLMAQAAPSWYAEPLIIYSYQGLHKIDTGEIIAEIFTAAVTSTGEVLDDIPRNPAL